MLGTMSKPSAKSVNAGDIDVSKPYRGAVFISVVTAATWLLINHGNRRVRRALVDYLMRQIRNGEWQSDHPQPIVFSDAGRLLDGQHRLFAMVLALATEVKTFPSHQKLIETLDFVRNSPEMSSLGMVAEIKTGVRDKLREYLDTGISRSLDDRCTFSNDQEENRRIGQIINVLFYASWENKGRPSPEEASQIFLDNADGIAFASSCMRKNQRMVTRASVMAALAEMYQRSPDLAVQFGEAYLQPTSDVQQAAFLRDYCLRNPSAGGMQATVEAYEKSVYCMQALIDGRIIKRIQRARWQPIGTAPEQLQPPTRSSR